MGTVVEFKRPAPAAEPAYPPKREWRYMWLDNFDEISRYITNPDFSRDDLVHYINYWRKEWGLEAM